MTAVGPPAPSAFPEPVELSLDGIRTFWFDGPEPATAVLSFRVGSIDESLPMLGISHLVEHLALHGLRERTYGINGFVELLRTSFTATGSKDELSDFLASVTQGIVALPFERLEQERRVLLTESASRTPGLLEALMVMRYGALGPGVVAYQEYGLHHLAPEAIGEWSSRYFTKDNAVLWIHGPQPEALTFPLPRGAGRAAITVPPEIVRTPAWFNGLAGGVGIGVSVARSSEMTAAGRIAQRRALRRLRHDLGMSYSVVASYVPLSGERAHLTLAADALLENVERVRDDLIEVLDGLAADGPTEEELTEDRAEARRAQLDPNAAKGALDYRSHEALLGMEPKTFAELYARHEALTSGMVAEKLREALPTLLVSLPVDQAFPGSRFAAVPSWSAKRVRGKKYRPKPMAGERGSRSLELAHDGVTAVYDGNPLTVRFDECALLIKWADEARELHGNDGFRLYVAPWQWRDGDEVAAAIDRSVPQARTIELSDRPKGPYADRLANRPAMRRGFVVALYIMWWFVTAILVTIPFAQPQLGDEDVGGLLNPPVTEGGEIDCGGPAWKVVFQDAYPPGPPDPVLAELARVCLREARIQTGAGVIGAVSLLFALLAAGRGVRRRVRRGRRAEEVVTEPPVPPTLEP